MSKKKAAQNDEKVRNLQRSVKQRVLGRTQTATLIAPPGFLDTSKRELLNLIGALQTPIKGELAVAESNGRLVLEEASIANITEIMVRGLSFSDIRLRIFKRRMSNLSAIAEAMQQIDFEIYLRKGQKVRVRANCERSLINNEKQLEQTLCRVLESKGFLPSSAANNETGSNITLHVQLEHNVFLLEIGLAGAPLYQRGYRAQTSTLAPLREDLAAAACLEAKEFLQQHQLPLPDFVFVPYAGSGTLGFESVLTMAALSPLLFKRNYACESMQCHSSQTLSWLRKQMATAARETTDLPARVVFVEKHPEQERELSSNLEYFLQALRLGGIESPPQMESVLADIFSVNLGAVLANARKHVFVPLNPPYGIRLESNKNTEALYRETGRTMSLLARAGAPRNIAVSGFILCPSEQTWELFCRATPSLKKKTVHFTQGGRDIRLCLFCSTKSQPAEKAHTPAP